MILEDTKSTVSMMARQVEGQERPTEETANKDKEFEQKDDTMTEHVMEELPDVPEFERLPEEIRTRRLKLYQAALKGDWRDAERIFEVHPDDISAGISKRGDTALHIAAAANHTAFAVKLLKKMDHEAVAHQNNIGSTALSFAAANGNLDLAEMIIDKDRYIAIIRDSSGTLPIEMAASLGHKDMVRYLYQEIRGCLDAVDCIELLVTLIKVDLYDLALELLMVHPELAIACASNNETALHALARKELLSPNQKLARLSRRCFDIVSSAKDVQNKRQQAVLLIERIWKEVVRLSDSKISELIAKPWRQIFVAAKQGNVEFLSILIREYPDLIWKVDEDGYSIFHIAVLYRQERVFKLIYEIGSITHLIVSSTDNLENNILHLAGMLAPPDRLNTVPGPALQLQQELLWFEEVSKVVQSMDVEAKNKQGLTPKALFAKHHEELKEKGEIWLKDTAAACMLVATLIAIVAFAAAFTVLGGYKGVAGIPFFLKRASFKIFAISDAVSLASSSTSILYSISIFTSSRPQNNYLRSPMRRLKFGLLTLFVSIAAMVVMFSATFFTLFDEGNLRMAILVTAIAGLPVILLMRLRAFDLCIRLPLSERQKSHANAYASEHYRFHNRINRLFYKPGEERFEKFHAHCTSPWCDFSIRIKDYFKDSI